MKVKELIALLQTHDPELEVWIEDANWTGHGDTPPLTEPGTTFKTGLRVDTIYADNDGTHILHIMEDETIEDVVQEYELDMTENKVRRALVM